MGLEEDFQNFRRWQFLGVLWRSWCAMAVFTTRPLSQWAAEVTKNCSGTRCPSRSSAKDAESQMKSPFSGCALRKGWLWLVDSSWGSLRNSHCCTFSEFGCQEISLGSEAQVRTCLHAIFCNARVSLLQVYQAGLAGLKSHIWQDKQGPIRQTVLHHPLSHNPTRYSLHYPTNPNSAVTLETSVEQEVKILFCRCRHCAISGTRCPGATHVR